MQMLAVIILAGIWFIAYTANQTSFHDAAIGLMFTGILALNAIYDKVEHLHKLFDDGKE